MTGPKRIQRSRAKGWRAPEGAVYVGRPTRWGNPFRGERQPGGTFIVRNDMGEHCGTATAEQLPGRLVELFDLHTGPMGAYEFDAQTLAQLRAGLAGRDLTCWCPLDQECHADVLLDIANREVTE